MKYNKLLPIMLFFICCNFVYADMTTIFVSTDMTATRGVTSGGEARGFFNDITAFNTNAYSATNDVTTLNLSNYTGTTRATIVNVTFEIRMNTSGTWGNDLLAVQYSNDSGTTWFTASSSLQPGAALANYGNYTVLSAFTQFVVLNRSQVRLLYTRSGGADGIRSGVDGVQMYVWYAPPPTVTLASPPTLSWSRSENVTFNFTPSSLISLANCSIYINGTFNRTNQTTLVNGTSNELNITGFRDGVYTWNVTCKDTSTFDGTAITAFTIKVDTQAPNITLVAPEDDNISSSFTVNFTFNVTDSFNVTTCSLVIDDIVKNTTSGAVNVSKKVNVSLFSQLTNGDHSWYVNCTDEANNTNQSSIFNISIQVTTPVVSTDKGTYIKGEWVNITGINWQAEENVTINITLANGTQQYFNVTANATGGINRTSWWINYTYPTGKYNLTASQTNNPLNNHSITFNVNNRTVNITLDSEIYMQGDTVVITGIGFHPLSNVNLTINYTGGRNNSIVNVDYFGNFTFSYNLNLTAVNGTYNITIFDLNFSFLNATANFSVINRTARIITNRSTYVANESAGVNGTSFSIFGTVLLRIYNTVTQKLGLGFPVYTYSDINGNWNYTWFVNNTCSGNYTIVGEDQNLSVRANKTILIWNQFSSSVTGVPTGITGNINTTPSLSAVGSSDDIAQNIALTAVITDGYLELNFLGSIPKNATFVKVNISLEHSRTTNKVTNFQMYWVNSSGLTTLGGTGCTGTPPDTDGTTTCDVTAHVRNTTIANNITIRINYTRSSGGSGDAVVDVAVMNYSWTGDLYSCKEFGDVASPPVVSNVSVTPGAIVLNAGTTKVVECNFTVTDANGATEISGANVTLYTGVSVSTSAVTNVSKYDNSTCELLSTGVDDKVFRCRVALLYYAANGTWTCNATGISTDGISSTTRTFTIDPLYAITVNDTFMNFGNLQTGALSDNVTQNITNVGNMALNISVRGYGRVMDDNSSFTCTTQNLSIDLLKFAGNITATYDEKESLANTSKQLRFTIEKQINPTLKTNSSFWQVRIPANISETGQCNGTIVFQADAT
jgi:hypothetical protein